MDDLRINGRITLPAAELSWSASRASGPGGQNVNKVASKVDLRFDLEGSAVLTPTVKNRLRKLPAIRLDSEGRIIIVSQTTRDQARNLDDARQRLAEMVRAALVVPKRRKKTRPSRGARERRLKAKKERAGKKETRKKVEW